MRPLVRIIGDWTSIGHREGLIEHRFQLRLKWIIREACAHGPLLRRFQLCHFPGNQHKISNVPAAVRMQRDRMAEQYFDV